MTDPGEIQIKTELRRSSAMNCHQQKPQSANVVQRSNTLGYELSEDLRAKYIQRIESKYGKYKAHHYARRIQAYYRKYRMRKNYEKLKIDRRNSRKLDLPSFFPFYKSLASPKSPKTINEIIKMDMKKQSSYEDLIIDKAYKNWDNGAEKNTETNVKVNEEHKTVQSASVNMASISSTLTSTTSTILSKSVNSKNISPTLANNVEINCYKLHKSIPISHSTMLCEQKDKMVSSEYCKGNLPICSDLNNSFHVAMVSPKLSFGSQIRDKSDDHMSRFRCGGSTNFSTSAFPVYLSNPKLIGRKFQRSSQYQTAEKNNKRLYRVSLNIFNKNSLKGIYYLNNFKFLEPQPDVVAKFLMTRKGVSRTGIGDYLGQMKDELAMNTLKYFVRMVDMRNKEIDVALRQLLSLFKIPGESQKITCIMEEFQQAYIEQNYEHVTNTFKHIDAVMILAYAIIMLHTDLYNPSVKAKYKMTKDQFIRNLRNADDVADDPLSSWLISMNRTTNERSGARGDKTRDGEDKMQGKDIDSSILTSIYDRIKTQEMKTFSDHTDQVRKIDQLFYGKFRPLNLVQSHRRLVCYCRLCEVRDCNKKYQTGAHQREIFLFNDMLVVTKAVKGKKGVKYQCKLVISLSNVDVVLFETPYYPWVIQLKRDKDILATFNTKSLDDRKKFVDDLVETIEEVSVMDRFRIDEELIKQIRLVKSPINPSSEVTLRKHNNTHKSDQSVMKKEKSKENPSKISDILISVQSKSIPREDQNIIPSHIYHQRSASGGQPARKCDSATNSPNKKTSFVSDQPNVYNEENRISGDSGLQEDLE